jgi:hypothetical protein
MADHVAVRLCDRRYMISSLAAILSQTSAAGQAVRRAVHRAASVVHLLEATDDRVAMAPTAVRPGQGMEDHLANSRLRSSPDGGGGSFRRVLTGKGLR